MALVVSLLTMATAYGDVIWDFENGNDHGFTLWSLVPPIPAPDDPNTAGDEALTGGLPDAGVAWNIGTPDQFDGQKGAGDPSRGNYDANGLLDLDLGKDRMTRDHGFLNTYSLNQHGDYVHTKENDQIATSPVVELYPGAVLTVIAAGGGPGQAPTFDPDPNLGYTDGSGGIAVLSAEDGTLLASTEADGHGGEKPFTLDLSAFAGQKVIIDVVDAFEGGWGWLAVDEIRITNAAVLEVNWDFENGNDHGFILWSLVPPIPAPDDPNTAGDEALTGGLPDAGVAWNIGTPDQFDGQKGAGDPSRGNYDANGLLDLDLGKDRMTRDHGFLNTYSLNQHGDYVHTKENDQIATSPVVELYPGAVLTVIAAGGGPGQAPTFDPDPNLGYTDGSGGIAVLSAEDGTLLASTEADGHGGEKPFTLDLSAFAGQKVIIDVVDAFEGGWGWLAVDEIVITNAKIVKTAAMIVNPGDLSAGFDQAQYDRLVATGYEVTVVAAGDVGSSFTIDDADGVDLLLVSESISSSAADPLIGTTTPVMHNESFGWGNWLASSETQTGWLAVADVDIVNDAHPIAVAAGVSAGALTFFDPNTGATTDLVSSLAPGAELIAQTTDGTDYFALIFTIDQGGELADGSAAPARFAGFSMPADQTFDVGRMTDEAWALWDATVTWLDPKE
jgi:hypothetical protein